MKHLKFHEDEKILIIAPHPDDEIFCCSGILMNYAKQCDVVLLTYGEKGNPGWSKSRTARIRKKEFHNVMNYLKVHRYVELNLIDGEVKNGKSVFKRIPYEKYDYVFLPSRYDNHIDHKCVFSWVYLEVCRKKKKPKLYEYEMWGMLRTPTHYIDITDKIEEKQALMMLYQSQHLYVNYSERIVALNYFRAIEATKANYIECFFENRKPNDLLSIIYQKTINCFIKIP